MEECLYWLAPCDFLSLLSQIPRDYRPRAGTAHSGRGPSTSNINQENAPPTCLEQSDGGVSSVEVPSQVSLARQVDKN